MSTASAGGCGCASRDPVTAASWTSGKGGCACGGGCGGAGCGCGAGTSSQPQTAACISGSGEATKRYGVVTGGCFPPRPRYFPGQLVTDSDLTAGVDYHRKKQLFANAMLSGWGIYCGFSLTIDEATCSVCVGPGVAVDAKGRELVNDDTICIQRPKSPGDGRDCDPCAPLEDESLYLAIVYDDCFDGAKPRYGTACGPTTDPGCDYSRTRERARLVWLSSLDPSYWTSGCLPDPCRTPGEPDSDCNPKLPTNRAPLTLDRCTPQIGIRGGYGVEVYASAMDAYWSLSKNVQLITDARSADGKKDGDSCRFGAATLVDVISGAACDRCHGEAVVVLAQVRWTTTADGVPRILVEPLRRRVLSNANLTYLVEWLLERVLCGPQAVQPTPEEKPPARDGKCADPCIDDEKLVVDIAVAAVGREAKAAAMRQAQAQAAYWQVIKGKRTYEAWDRDAFLDVVLAAVPDAGNDEKESAFLRFHELLGQAGSREAIDRGIGLMFPDGVPEKDRYKVEDEVYAFMRRRNFEEVGTASYAEVAELANKINADVLHLGKYPKVALTKLATRFPDARREGDPEVANLRAQMRELQNELERIKKAPESHGDAGEGEVDLPPADEAAGETNERSSPPPDGSKPRTRGKK